MGEQLCSVHLTSDYHLAHHARGCDARRTTVRIVRRLPNYTVLDEEPDLDMRAIPRRSAQSDVRCALYRANIPRPLNVISGNAAQHPKVMVQPKCRSVSTIFTTNPKMVFLLDAELAIRCTNVQAAYSESDFSLESLNNSSNISICRTVLLVVRIQLVRPSHVVECGQEVSSAIGEHSQIKDGLSTVQPIEFLEMR